MKRKYLYAIFGVSGLFSYFINSTLFLIMFFIYEMMAWDTIVCSSMIKELYRLEEKVRRSNLNILQKWYYLMEIQQISKSIS